MCKGTRYTSALGQGIEDEESIILACHITSPQTDNTSGDRAGPQSMTHSQEATSTLTMQTRVTFHITHIQTYAGLSLAVSFPTLLN